jgi:hypothetical protein
MIAIFGRVAVLLIAYVLILMNPFAFYLGGLFLLLLFIRLGLMYIEVADTRLNFKIDHKWEL